MTKKKLLSLCMVGALAGTAVVGGTLAYFTDTDSAKNVMTTGNVSIIQNEYQRNEDKEIETFEDNKKLYPVTEDTMDGYDEKITVDGYTVDAFGNEHNVLDKIVNVKNDGTEEAYVRTLFAFEMLYDADENEWIDPVNTIVHTVVNEGATAGKGIIWPKDDQGNYLTITVGGTQYIVGEYYYRNDSKLAAGETSHPSLTQIYLDKNTGNEFYAQCGDGNYDILTLSQGAQTAGFADAYEALNTAFGEVTAENCAKWFEAVQ